MRVHQAGGFLMQARGADVDDWSWGRTRRRLGLLWRLTLPYRGRTALSALSLLTATATALAPPYLAKYALDDAIKHRGGTQLYVVVAIFVAAGLAKVCGPRLRISWTSQASVVTSNQCACATTVLPARSLAVIQILGACVTGIG